MGARVFKKDELPGVCISEMKDGDIGEIVSHPILTNYAGNLVQRCGDVLITIGRGSGQNYRNALGNPDERFRVRILQPGELIEIT